jgi:hypothetical protein
MKTLNRLFKKVYNDIIIIGDLDLLSKKELLELDNKLCNIWVAMHDDRFDIEDLEQTEMEFQLLHKHLQSLMREIDLEHTKVFIYSVCGLLIFTVLCMIG